MKKISIKLLLNRVQYDPSGDLKYIYDFLNIRGIVIDWHLADVNITGYSVREVQNPMGNYQYVLTGAEPLVMKYLSPTDNICALVIQGYKDFGERCPSESEDKAFLPGTKTVFLSANADDPFMDQVPNFRVWLLHEIMHGLGTIANNAGFPTDDCMDLLYILGRPYYYFNNQFPEFSNSNFVNMIERLEPWINS